MSAEEWLVGRALVNVEELISFLRTYDALREVEDGDLTMAEVINVIRVYGMVQERLGQ